MRALLSLLCLTCAACWPTRNLTVYRITPRNYTGLINLDTGDAAGDAFFGLYEKSAPVVCAHKSKYGRNILCDNVPILQIPGFNVYTSTEIEVDSRLGDYAECNPDQSTGIFSCGHFHQSKLSCWFNNSQHPEWRSAFAPFCNLTQCSCPAVESWSVGAEQPKFGSLPPAGTPPSCASNYYVLPGTGTTATPIKTVPVATLGDCCSVCTSMNEALEYSCGFYAYKEGSCAIYSNTRGDQMVKDPSSQAGWFSGLGLSAFVQRAAGQLSNILNGTWYSTQAAGLCPPGTAPTGDGKCWWRVIEQTRNVNASCVNDNMVNKVIETRPHCFQECPRPEDQGSDCWIGCLFEALGGNFSAVPVVRPIDPTLLVRAFEMSFETNDPSRGGCPEVPPCPEPCLPPCWAVEAGQPCSHKE